MTAKKILFLLAFVAAASLAYARASLWNEQIFPNDHEWSRNREIDIFDDSDNDIDAKFDKVCETEECHRVVIKFIYDKKIIVLTNNSKANRVLGAMNESVDPCDNFYQFTCGKWEANNPIPPSDVKFDILDIYQTLVDRRVSEILEKKIHDSDILPVKQAKKWYRSCMNTDILERIGMKQIDLFVTQAGGWPIAMKETDWNYESHPWQEVERYYAQLTGHNAFYDVRAGPSKSDSEFGEILIEPSELLINKLSMMNEGYDSFLLRVIHSFVIRSESAASVETYIKEAEELIRFEVKLYQLYMKNNPENPEEWMKDPMSFHDFIDSYENDTEKNSAARIHWKSGIQRLFRPLKIKVDPSTLVYVQNSGYMRGLGEILKNTSPRTIVNYVHWNFIAKALSYTTENMRNEMFNISFLHVSLGAKERRPRWRKCVNDMEMKYTAAYVYSKNYFPNSTRHAVRKMLKNIQLGLEANIDNSNWLDETSKDLIKEKLKSMKLFIGYPEWHSNGTAVTNYYKGLKIGSQYLHNALSYMRFDRKIKLMEYTMTKEETDIGFSSPTLANAEYELNSNSLSTPPVMFQWPLLTPGLPDNFNFAQVGFVIGHEMSHGFDNMGIRRGKDGKDTDLRTDMLKSYFQRAKCFVDQFDRYFGVTEKSKEEGITLKYDDLGKTRGSKTAAENIADSTGLQTVFQAYKDLKVTKGSDEPKLPGLEKFTDEQLFFIAFGTHWCGAGRSGYTKEAEYYPHSPLNLRVNGAVSNTNDFAEIFYCPEGSAMNPRDKCNIWEKSEFTPKVIPSRRINGNWRHTIKE